MGNGTFCWAELFLSSQETVGRSGVSKISLVSHRNIQRKWKWSRGVSLQTSEKTFFTK